MLVVSTAKGCSDGLEPPAQQPARQPTQQLAQQLAAAPIGRESQDRTQPQRIALASDFFCNDDTGSYAGRHIILDLYEAQRLSDEAHVRAGLLAAAAAAKATALAVKLHRFESSGGISGVVVLAESHISIHTWPEHGYAALDIFTCGASQPEQAVPVLVAAFKAQRHEVMTIRRGVNLKHAAGAPPR